MWKNLHRHKKMMPFSVRLTLRWVLEPRFSSIGPRLGSMVRRWRVLCIILWLSMWTICFCCVFLSFAPMWKNLRKSLETTLKIPQDYLGSSSIPPKSPFRCPSKATSITSKMIQKLRQALPVTSRNDPDHPALPTLPRPDKTRSWPAWGPQNRR